MKYRRNVLIILVLTLMSQSFAVANTFCPMMMDNIGSSSMEGMVGMDHSSHDMSQSGFSEQKQSCCGEGDCNMMNCASSFLLPINKVNTVLPDQYVFHDQLPPSKLGSHANTLYRPPII